MENLKIKIRNEYKEYAKNFIKSTNVKNLFSDKAGYVIAIAKAFKDYFDNMLYDDEDVIFEVVEMANKFEMNLFDFVIENYWAFDESFNFMEYKECKEFLEGLK